MYSGEKMKKYYAVRIGRVPGIYETWNECKAQVHGFASASYKSFTNREEALSFVNGNENGQCKKICPDKETLLAYVDGSYNAASHEFSYGIVYLREDGEEVEAKKVEDPSLVDMRNVAGEIKGAEMAMRYALKNQYKKLYIFHDYEGIAKWCTGEWKTNKEGTRAYRNFFEKIKHQLEVHFVKVVAHTNIKYNDMADALAKSALGIQ